MELRKTLIALPVVVLATISASVSDDHAKSPDQDLPAHITRLTFFGERADFSHDGKRVLFVEKTFGDVYEIELATKAIRLLTGHYKHLGYTRALYLANGDILLSGPDRFDPKNPGPSRVQCLLYVLDKRLAKPPTALGTKCSEGPAVSRRRMHIAWTHVAEQYPDELPRGSSRIYEADVVIDAGTPKLANQKLVLDSRDLPFRCTLESQNFLPPDERELTLRWLQGVEPGCQRRWKVHGLPTGEVERSGRRRLRNLSLRLRQSHSIALNTFLNGFGRPNAKTPTTP
jgi:hypothetical protein